ncbi:hypothetical protein DA717_06715 [Piscirickettsiaceae bacterium NZ-RLO2]|nr:hypothetical protein DA717_06715 [Piscirickettsiaceae bacterium NZ-RLO2]
MTKSFWFIFIIVTFVGGVIGASFVHYDWGLTNTISILGVFATFGVSLVALINADRAEKIAEKGYLYGERIRVFNDVMDICIVFRNTQQLYISETHDEKLKKEISNKRDRLLNKAHNAAICSPIIFKSHETHNFIVDLKNAVATAVTFIDSQSEYAISEDDDHREIYNIMHKDSIKYGRYSSYNSKTKRLNLLDEFPDLLELNKR